jgi:hypothetical protein
VQIPDPVMNWNPYAAKREPVAVTMLVLVSVSVDVLVDVTVVLVPDS